jgi:uncharacterized protein YkwD
MRGVVSLVALAGACAPGVTAVTPAAPAVEPLVVPGLPEAVAIHHEIASHRASQLDPVALAAARSASIDHVVSAGAVRESMAALGSGLWPYVLVGWGSDDEIAQQLDRSLAELRGEVGELGEVATATASGPAGHVGVLIAVPPPSLPIALDHEGDSTVVHVAWHWAFEPAAFAVTTTASKRLDATRTDDGLAVALDCARGPALEITDGDRVVASIVDACGALGAPGAGGSAGDIGPPAATRPEFEQRVFALINRERVAHGRAALAWDEDAFAFARAHSADMAKYTYIGHEAPGGATLKGRVAAAAFHVEAARENVGHAWGPGEAHIAFMGSPGHRENLLAGDVDRGAVGIASDPRDPKAFYITEFFRR